MADRWAVLIAIDKPLHPVLGTTPYAEAGVKALANVLAAVGWDTGNIVSLFGPHATRTVIESRFRKLRKAIRKGDDVLAVFAGRGYSHDGLGYLACWDTLPDDLADTALPLGEFIAGLTAKAGQVTGLLDIGTGSPVGDFAPHLDGDELTHLFADSPKAVALIASEVGEPSHASATLKASAWMHLVNEALAGRAPKALHDRCSVTAVSLHRFLQDELPRVLRKHFDAEAVQTPQLYGEQNGGFMIADLSAQIGSAGALDAGRLRRVVFRSDSNGRVKDLSGFRKTFTVPENVSTYNRKFVAGLAVADLKADLESVFEAAREHLGYKNKDVTVNAGNDGFGFMRGPDFEYTVTVSLDPSDPSQVTWRREVGQFGNAAFLRGAGFDAVFGKLFDQLVFEFAVPVDVSAMVDRLEDRPPPGLRIHAASDGSQCDLTLSGFAGRMTLCRTSLTVRGRTGDASGLLDQFLRFVGTVGPLGEPLALPRGK